MQNKPNLVRLWRIQKPLYNNELQRKMNNGHPAKTNPIKPNSPKDTYAAVKA